MQKTQSPKVAPGEMVGGRYRIKAELGRGGMSIVYRAYDPMLDREVALKLLKMTEEEPRNVLFLQQEFRAMVRLRHPRLVQVFDYGILDNGVSYFTMELLEGEDLTSFRQLSLESTVQILLSIAEVLAFMHARGYVHRDVKPSNVRVLPSTPGQPIEVKLMDCGLTEQLGRKGGAVAGTLAYLAPEAWLGSPTDVRGDLYALGVLAYEIIAGQLPFAASTGVQLLKTKTERPRDLRSIRPEVPVELARLVSLLLAPEPANRPASAAEVISRLCEYADIDYQPDPMIYLRTPALVGRSCELHQLRCAITEAFSSKPHPTVIVGPAGAGKTRLFDEVLLESGLRGAVVARAVARGFAGSPCGVLEDLLAPLLHVPEAQSVLERIGGRDALLPPQVPPNLDEGHRTVDPIAARRTMHAAFATFLDSITKHRQVVLAIDDIHLADAASLDALASLAGAGVHGNLAVIATQRTGEPVSQTLEHFLSVGDRLELDRMTREQIGELIVGALGPVAVSPTLLIDIERSCSGNVYFALEILRDLARRGLIERRRTKTVLPESLDNAGLPGSLSEALGRRVATLSPAALRVARLSAVLDRAMDLPFARSISKLCDEALLDAVDELRCQELIDIQERCIKIHHPRLREVLYVGIGAEERRILHREVAEAMLADSEAVKRDRAAELGSHFAEAGDQPRALEYLVRAGDARYQGFAYFDARLEYQRALELLSCVTWHRRGELERKLNDRLGRICFYHDHEHGPQYLEVARRRHLRYGALSMIVPLSQVLGAAVAVAIGVTFTTLYNVLRLRPWPLRRTLERLVDYFAATTYLSNCYVYSGRAPSALRAADDLLPFVHSRKRIPRVGYLMSRVAALYAMNRFDEAVAGCEESLAILEQDTSTPLSEHDRVHATGGALVTRLWVDLTRGYAKNSPWWKPVEEFVRLHPTAMLESWMMEIRVFAASRRGNLTETEQAWERFVQKAAQAEVKFVHARTKFWLGRAYLDAGRTSEAQDMADEIVSVARTLDNPFILAYGTHLRGLALHAWEQLEDADDCLEEAARVASHSDVACWELHHSIRLSQAALALDRRDHATARHLARQVLEHNATLRHAHDLHRCHAHRILGRLSLNEGWCADAIVELNVALAFATELDDPMERAQCLHYLADAHREAGDNEAAERCRGECVQLLGGLENGYQLHRFGYSAADGPTSSAGVTVLTRVVELVAGAELNSRAGAEGTAARRESRANNSVLAFASARCRDETLVAGDSSDSC